MDFTPTVLHPISTPLQFVQRLLRTATEPTTLIVCTTRSSFLESLVSTSDEPQLLPTLETLSLSRSISVAYCPTVQALHAFLIAHTIRMGSGTVKNVNPVGNATEHGPQSVAARPKTMPMLAILGLLALHEPSTGYSAQGIGRAFAAAVSAAHAVRQKLVVGECPQMLREWGYDRNTADEEETSGNYEDMVLDEEEMREGLRIEQSRELQDPWNEQVPMLNTTTKSFGPGQRGWVGRTVELRRIAARWCRFVDIREDFAAG